jgi:transposase-like protein
MKIKHRIEKRKRDDVVTALVCPDCGGTNLVYEGGYVTGRKYHCPDCHYRGAFVLERRVIVKDDETVEEI